MTVISQSLADDLLAMEKCQCDSEEMKLPGPGAGVELRLISADQSKELLLSMYRGIVGDQRVKSFQIRWQTVALARLCCGTQSHRNPDLGLVSSPHLHLYREGENAK